MAFYSMADVVEILNARGKPSIQTLHEIWEQRPVPSKRGGAGNDVVFHGNSPSLESWQNDLALSLAFVRCALKAEEYLLVSDVVNETFAHWQNRLDGDPFYLSELFVAYAQAKSRLGQSGEAFRRLEPWSRDTRLNKSQRARIMLQLGNILREDSHTATDRTIRFQLGERAFCAFKEAAELDPSLVEARVKSILALLVVSESRSARRANVRRMANDALQEIRQNQKTTGKTFASDWHSASLLATLGKFEQAMNAYQTLSSHTDADIGNLADARYESRFVAMALEKPAEYFKDAFPPLELIVFAGHMPDLPGAPPRFPPDMIPTVRGALRKKLQKLGGRAALVSAAAGADLLFVDALLERPGHKLHVVLPWEREEFLRTSVQPYDSEGRPPVWRPLFDRALKEATTLRQLSLLYEPGDEVGWQYPMEVTAGIALQIARVAHLDIRPLVLWDCKPGFGAGGTASFFELWSEYLVEPPIVIRLPKKEDRAELIVRPTKAERCERPTLHREVKSMLFADVIGYSKLAEKVIPEFVEVFLTKLSRLVADSPYSPRCLNMWGDEIYGVFDYAHEAGSFALQLAKFVREEEKEWIKNELCYEEADGKDGKPRKFPLNLRIGLHTGPVLRIYNPVVRQLTYTGSHVSRAARIQPIANPGEVYASEEFVALAELDSSATEVQSRDTALSNNGLICEYAGTMALAKNYPGRFRIYRVRARPTLPMEQLAATVHAKYCEKERAKKNLPPGSVALLSWQQLSEEDRESNRAQVADIPFKLGILGYELSSGNGLHPEEMEFTPDQIESLAKLEHDRWLMQKERQGWTYAPVRDNSRKHHDCLVAWNALTEEQKNKDRETIRNLPELIEGTGLRIARDV